MIKDTLSFELLGDIDLTTYAHAIQRFRGLVEALTEDVAHGIAIVWNIKTLSAGSALAEIRGESDRIDVVERVVRGYAEVGRALEKNAAIPFSDRVIKEARAITGILDGKITSIRFETPDEDIIINTPFGTPPEIQPHRSYGTVKGRVETLSRRKGLRFIIYEALSDRAVSCYVSERDEQLLRDIWGRKVIVEGLVTRDPLSGQPFTVRDVSSIAPFPDSGPGGYQDARGAVPIEKGMIPPEDAIRRGRDV